MALLDAAVPWAPRDAPGARDSPGFATARRIGANGRPEGQRCPGALLLPRFASDTPAPEFAAASLRLEPECGNRDLGAAKSSRPRTRCKSHPKPAEPLPGGRSPRASAPEPHAGGLTRPRAARRDETEPGKRKNRLKKGNETTLVSYVYCPAPSGQGSKPNRPCPGAPRSRRCRSRAVPVRPGRGKTPAPARLRPRAPRRRGVPVSAGASRPLPGSPGAVGAPEKLKK